MTKRVGVVEERGVENESPFQASVVNQVVPPHGIETELTGHGQEGDDKDRRCPPDEELPDPFEVGQCLDDHDVKHEETVGFAHGGEEWRRGVSHPEEMEQQQVVMGGL